MFWLNRTISHLRECTCTVIETNSGAHENSKSHIQDTTYVQKSRALVN